MNQIACIQQPLPDFHSAFMPDTVFSSFINQHGVKSINSSNDQIYYINKVTKMQASPNESKILEQYLQQREKEEVQEMTNKKSYLKENILDVYIKEEHLIDQFLDFFLVYLKKTKGIQTQQHSLDHLTLPELKQLTAQFRALHPPAEPTVVIDIENSLDVSMSRGYELSQIKQEQFDAQRVYYPNGTWDYELEGYEECKRVKPFFSVEEDCKNIVVIFEKQEVKKVGGFFGIGCRSQLWIEIRTNLFKDHTMRKIQDFLSLRTLLAKSFPFVFIYPLQITDKQLEKVSDESVRGVMVNQCRKFINFVCKNQLLLQCFYTHRFFKENNFQSFVSNHKRDTKEMPNRVKSLENTEGCVPLQISDRNQLIKKDYLRKSEELERIWIKFDESNTRISNKLKEVHVQIDRQRKQMERVILQFTNVNPLLKNNIYETVISTMISYNEIFKNYQENLNNFQILFESLNLQIATQAKKTWSYFTKYAKQINAISQEYHARRKVFLQKEAKRIEENVEKEKQKKVEEKSPNGDGKEQKMDPVNLSIISNLGISVNSVKETAWIQRFSKWQGYINKQFTNSFERLLQIDIDTLCKILQQNINNRIEMQRKQEALIKCLQMGVSHQEIPSS